MIGKRASTADLIDHLHTLRSEESLEGIARYGIVTDAALGISNPVLRKIARAAGKDHVRAFALWDSGIREARLLALFTMEPTRLTAVEARRLAGDFASWEIVDAAADLFVEAGLLTLVEEFAADEREFVRRAAFAMIAGAAVHLKQEPGVTVIAWLGLIESHATDPRNFVKKAVNWSLRSIGKRSRACHGPALALAQKLAASADRTERWNGKDCVRELTAENTLARISR
ncbi:DNA alkylation repair protein [Shinella kummerowiae]|uniref:DNA alkylation repair protein n=1 Tax=Shinella kummerowiae TaxID=417745 RepID=A0A6N8S9K8_9HYPH|nr:DNA alkylation repair protein [Shinella kummerowiae]MXN43662.1 DNA alkylation repair protein [Shinella kummerowiae]